MMMDEVPQHHPTPDGHMLLVNLQITGDLGAEKKEAAEDDMPYELYLVNVPKKAELADFDVLAGQSLMLATDQSTFDMSRDVVEHLVNIGVENLCVWDVSIDQRFELVRDGKVVYERKHIDNETKH